MGTIKLSMESFLLRWAELCIDWFMNFFADPEYYWVEESYPIKHKAAANLEKEQEVETTEKTTQKRHRLTGLISFDKLIIKSITKIVDTVQLAHHTVVKLSLQVNWPKIIIPHKHMQQFIKME